MARTAKDLTGQRFGRLVAVEKADWYVTPRSGRRKEMWRCLCDCGQETTVQRTNLTFGLVASCGCAGKNQLSRPASVRYSAVRSGAKVRGLAFELALEKFTEMTARPCRYCKQARGSHRGIDRVDNALGYVEGNCVPCCWVCNRAKAEDLSPDELVEWARDIYLASLTILEREANGSEHRTNG